MRKSTTVLAAVMALVSLSVTLAQSEKQLTLHLASLTPVDGFDVKTVDGAQVYISSRVAVTESAVLSADATSSGELSMLLTEPGAHRLQSLIRRNDVSHMAIIAGGRMIGVEPFAFQSETSGLTLSELSPKQVSQLSGVVAATPTGAMISLVPSQTHVFPGRPVTIDVYVSGVESLRTFQVTMAPVSGGNSGSLDIQDVTMDTTRSDYVYGQLAAVAAPDLSGVRLGGVLLSGGVDATEQLYVGTFTYMPSADAEGKFRLTVRGGDRSSLVWQADNTPVAFGVKSAVITVGNEIKTTTGR